MVRNDAVPEGNETFTVEISGARFGAEVGDRSTMQLIIRANDEPFGAFQFDTVNTIIYIITCKNLVCRLKIAQLIFQPNACTVYKTRIT